MMENIQKKIKSNWLLIVLVLFIGFSVVSGYILITGLTRVDESSQRFDQFMKTEMMDIVQNEVLSRVDEVAYELELIYDVQKSEMRQVVQYLVNEIDDHLEFEGDINVMREKLLEVIEENQDEVGGYQFFVLDSEGILLRASVDQRNVGDDWYDEQDTEGDFFVQEMLKAKDNPEGLFVTYNWAKEVGGQAIEKTSYCYYLPMYDVIVGTGSYEDDIDHALKESIYRRLQTYYENRESYIFIVGYDGVAKVFPDPSFIGNTTENIKSIDGVSLHEMFLDQVINEGAGFVNYKYHKKNTDIVSDKTTFIMPLDDWQVYIGMGFYNDDLNEEMLAYNNEFKSSHNREVVTAVAGLVITSMIVFVLIDKALKLQNKYLKQEDVIFEQLSHFSDEGIFIVKKNGEIEYHNRVIDHVFGDRIKEYIVRGKLELEHVLDSVHKIYSSTDREYYVEYKYENINYHGDECKLYFIKDVTEQMLQTNEFKKQALLDELTGLPNRRQLINDYDDYCFQAKPDDTLVLAMIDLDHFKVINDTYGHDMGDEVLKCLSEVFKERLRENDCIYRYGGEEFVVSLRDIKIEDAAALLEKIKLRFKEVTKEKFEMKISFSGGMVLVKDHKKVSSFNTYLKQSDELLYEAKNFGRDRIKY